MRNASLGSSFIRARRGTTLLAGLSTAVAIGKVEAGMGLIVQRTTIGANAGFLSVNDVAKVPGDPGTFTISSDDAAEDSTVSYYAFYGLPLVGAYDGRAASIAPGIKTGVASLTAGTVTIPGFAAGTLYAVQRFQTIGAAGFLDAAIVGTDLVVTSSNGADASRVQWWQFDAEALNAPDGTGSPAGGGPSLGAANAGVMCAAYSATLVAGAATIACPFIGSYSAGAQPRVLVTRVVRAGVNGHLGVDNVVPGVSFDVLSSDVGDTCDVLAVLLDTSRLID